MWLFNLITPAGSAPQVTPPSVRVTKNNAESELPKGPYKCESKDTTRGQSILKISIEAADGKRIGITSDPDQKEAVKLKKVSDDKVVIFLSYEKAVALKDSAEFKNLKSYDSEQIKTFLNNLMKSEQPKMEISSLVPPNSENGKIHEQQIKGELKIEKIEAAPTKNLQNDKLTPELRTFVQGIDPDGNVTEHEKHGSGRETYTFGDAIKKSSDYSYKNYGKVNRHSKSFIKQINIKKDEKSSKMEKIEIYLEFHGGSGKSVSQGIEDTIKNNPDLNGYRFSVKDKGPSVKNPSARDLLVTIYPNGEGPRFFE